MSRCNFCRYNDMRMQARGTGKRVKMIPAKWGMGGVEVFVVPHTISVKTIREWADDSDEWNKYHHAWMMEISDRCAC